MNWKVACASSGNGEEAFSKKVNYFKEFILISAKTAENLEQYF